MSDAPNFTIIASGGCNAKCDFCTDDKNAPLHNSYAQNLLKAIQVLPEEFRQVSITGGEPTISPDLDAILSLVKYSGRFDKVVFTTNGARLLKHLDKIASTVNHINVSRHAIGYEANVEIFKTRGIISDKDLQLACSEFNKRGVDVNLNHVYTKDSNLTEAYVKEYVRYAKALGASSVSFRYDQDENTLETTYLEELFFGYSQFNAGSCPVCRSHSILVDGLTVVFKASFSEPSDSLSYLYELIYQPNAKLTEDWRGDKVYPSPKPKAKVKTSSPTKHFVSMHGSSFGGGCGGKSAGSCGGAPIRTSCGGGGCGR